MLEQRTWLGPRSALEQLLLSFCSQQSVNSRSADLKQLLLGFPVQTYLHILFQHRNEIPQRGLQSLPAYAIHDHPNLPQRLYHLPVVYRLSFPAGILGQVADDSCLAYSSFLTMLSQKSRTVSPNIT